MSGYAASARLQGGSTRFALTGGRVERPTTERTPDGPLSGLVGHWAIEAAGDGPSVSALLGGRLDDLREAWSQTTFFLFDPNSWR